MQNWRERISVNPAVCHGRACVRGTRVLVSVIVDNVAAGVPRDEKFSGAGDSVLSERCRAEDRVLMTLDLDFANVQAYPPKSHPGIVVFRSRSQDKPTLVALLKRLVPALLQLSPKHQLWIVEPDRIRYREE